MSIQMRLESKHVNVQVSHVRLEIPGEQPTQRMDLGLALSEFGAALKSGHQAIAHPELTFTASDKSSVSIVEDVPDIGTTIFVTRVPIISGKFASDLAAALRELADIVEANDDRAGSGSTAELSNGASVTCIDL